MAVKIRDLVPEKREVKFGSGVLPLRGLKLPEIVALLVKHKEEVAPFFSGQQMDFGPMFVGLPSVVAEIIALSADAQGQEADILEMPAPDVIEALMAVWEISIPNVKKLVELIASAAKQLTAALPVPEASPTA